MRTKQKFGEGVFLLLKKEAVAYYWFSGGFTIPQKVRHLRLILHLFLGEEKGLCFVWFMVYTTANYSLL
jgi:hypothetical protein